MSCISKIAVIETGQQSAQMLKPEGLFYESIIAGDYKKSGYSFSHAGKSKTCADYQDTDIIKATLTAVNFSLCNWFEIPCSKKDESTETHLVFIAKKVASIPY